jgi:hypothetical protein
MQRATTLTHYDPTAPDPASQYLYETGALTPPDETAGLGSLIGGALGSVAGTFIGGPAGTALGAGIGGSLGGAIEGVAKSTGRRKKRRRARPAPPPPGPPAPAPGQIATDERRILADALATKSGPVMLDAALRVVNPEQYERDRVLGRLPSQMAEKRKRLPPHAFAGMSPIQRTRLTAAIQARKGLATWRQIQTEIAAEIAVQAAAASPSPPLALEQPDEQPEPNEPPGDEEPGDGYDTGAPLDRRPRPLRHISLVPLKVHQLAALVRAAPVLEKLDLRQLKLMAGTGGAQARDVSGVDPASRTYHAEPGETPTGITKKLTGSADRIPDLLASNPDHAKDEPIWRIPPGWLLFDHSSDTGALSTQRKYIVQGGDTPFGIAEKLGAKATHPKWWSELKAANPSKKTADNGGNWQSLWPGEEIGIPDSWPPHALAVPASGFPVPGGSPPPGSFPVPNSPPPGAPYPGAPNANPLPGWPPALPMGPAANSTMDPGVMLQSQGMLRFFSVQHPGACNPQDFGATAIDYTGTSTPRTVQAIQSFQLWWNQTHGSTPLRTDGTLDDATYKALYSTTVATLPPPVPSAPGEQPKPLPQNTTPIPVPQNTGPFPPPSQPGVSPPSQGQSGQQVPGLPPGWTWTDPTGPYGLPWQAPSFPSPTSPGPTSPSADTKESSSSGSLLPLGLLAAAAAFVL